MSTKMKKGILRPFRYISNMMDCKEPEMQIGFPTDVKHVAHIGWDGPSATNNNAAAPTWIKDYHSAPLDSASFRSETGGAAASSPWASQEIVLDGGSSLGDTSFRDTSEAGGIDVARGDSPPSPGTRRSRRHRSRGSATCSMDCMAGEATEKEKSNKVIRKNRKKGKDKASAGNDGSSATCQDLPAVPKKSNRQKNKGSSEGSAAPGKDVAEAAAEKAPVPPVAED